MRQIVFNLDASDKTLIFNNFVVQGENLATELVFNLSPEFQGYKYLIEFQNNSKTPVITPELLAVNNVVKYIVTNAVTTQAGILKVQFQAYDDNGKLIKSIVTNLKVAESIKGVTEIMPEAYVPWYLQAVEQANIATAKAEEAAQSAVKAADIMNKSSVTLNHQFTDVTARDAYFASNPTELVANLFIKVGTGYQQYINGVWEDVSAIIVELQKAKDVPLEDTENKYVAENVEDALIEIHDDLETHKSDYTSNKERTDLKIATVDKELNDFQKTLSQVNVNQEAKQTATGYGVVSLPKNAANGQVSAVIRGRTLKQELNYNRETMAEWTITSIVQKAPRGFTSMHNGVNSISALLDYNEVKSSTKYGILLYVSKNTTDSILLFDPNSFLQTASGLSLEKTIGNKKLSFTTRANITTNKRFQLYQYAQATGEIAFQDIRMFELPTGSEIENDFNTMTADQLAQKYPYIQGGTAKSTLSAGRLKSVGKNLFYKSKILLSNILTLSANGVYTSIDNGITHVSIFNNVSSLSNVTQNHLNRMIKLKANKTYRIKAININGIDTARLSLHQRSKDGILLKSIYSVPFDTSLTTESSSDGFIYLDIARQSFGFSFSDFQIEESTVATPYEPYTESNQYFTAKDSNGNIVELKSVGTAKDEIRVSEGKRIQRNKKYVLQASDIPELITTRTNMDLVVIYKPNDGIGYNTLQKYWATFEGYLETALAGDILDNIGKFSSSDASTKFYIMVAKGTYSTLEQAQTALAGTMLTYQLATPIETPIEVSGTLLSYPSGTIYVENAVADAGMYTDKFTILQQDLPIKEIERIAKVDFTTGVETQLDVIKAIIATDKLSFTHPDLVNGDIVFLTYFYDVESTQGETTVTYYDSRHTVKDKTLENKFYQWTIEVDNGTPSIKLAEV